MPGGAPARAFRASLIFFSNCSCCSWLNVMPSLSAWARRSAQSVVSPGFSSSGSWTFSSCITLNLTPQPPVSAEGPFPAAPHEIRAAKPLRKPHPTSVSARGKRVEQSTVQASSRIKPCFVVQARASHSEPQTSCWAMNLSHLSGRYRPVEPCRRLPNCGSKNSFMTVGRLSRHVEHDFLFSVGRHHREPASLDFAIQKKRSILYPLPKTSRFVV